MVRLALALTAALACLAKGCCAAGFDVDVFTAGVGEGKDGCFRIPTILSANGSLFVFVRLPPPRWLAEPASLLAGSPPRTAC